jgi:hypothetical protein
MKHVFFRAFMAIAALLALSTNALASSSTQGPSIFIRYQLEVPEVLQLLRQNSGRPIDPQSVEGRWLTEMGWLNVVKEHAVKPFSLTPAFETQILRQAEFLKNTLGWEYSMLTSNSKDISRVDLDKLTSDWLSVDIDSSRALEIIQKFQSFFQP